jgi:hypothetical protein
MQGNVLPGPLPAAPKRRRKGVVVGLALAGVGVAAVASAAVVVGARLGGGGDQPEMHLPDNTVMFAKVDLDPAANQKLDAIRFLQRFPDAGDVRDDTDLRRWAYEQLSKDSDNAMPWSQVEPWLGQRMGVGVLPAAHEAEPETVVAVQVTDEAAAKDALAKGFDGSSGAVVSGGWAIIAPTQALAEDAAAAAESSSLADDPVFADDADALGEDGIAAMWLDGAGLLPLLQESGVADQFGGATKPLLGTNMQGRLMGALRFDGATLELAGMVNGAEGGQATSSDASGVADLPASTTLGVGASVDTSNFDDVWAKALEQAEGTGLDPEALLAQVEEALGVSLPEDLVTLIGKGLTVGVEDFSGGSPSLGIRGRSLPGRDAGQIVDRLVTVATQSGLGLEQRETGDGWVLATTPGYADALAGDGDLGDREKVKKVLPGVDSAPVAFYADLEALATLAEENGTSAEDAQTMRELRAVGMSMTSDGESASFTVRLGG